LPLRLWPSLFNIRWTMAPQSLMLKRLHRSKVLQKYTQKLPFLKTFFGGCLITLF
jgi:hypothetical protein